MQYFTNLLTGHIKLTSAINCTNVFVCNQMVFIMKKTILTGILAIFACMAANASDGAYWQTETYTMRERFTADTISYYDDAYVSPRQIATTRPQACARVSSSMDVRPCIVRSAKTMDKPVQVKTHTEIIDHYQLYQPVVQYVPTGTYTQHRIIWHPRSTCNNCHGE